jgi:hypothetical protein
MKSDDFKNLPKGILSRKDREAFMIFETFEDIQEGYMKCNYLECFDKLDYRMYPFRLSADTKKALEYFGISEDAMKAYEDEINLKRQGGLRSSKPIQELLGTAWGFWYDHDWCESMTKLKEYCDQHGIPYKYLDP